MPPEWNTRSVVELPELFVSGLLHESDWPTLLGSTAFSRATLSKTIWLSEGVIRISGNFWTGVSLIWATVRYQAQAMERTKPEPSRPRRASESRRDRRRT